MLILATAALLLFPTGVLAQGTGGLELIGAGGVLGGQPSFQVGLGAAWYMKDEWSHWRHEMEAGYFSRFSHAPNGSAVLSTGIVYLPQEFGNGNWWPRISAGAAIAPVLDGGFRSGAYAGIGIVGWRTGSGSEQNWKHIEFRDYVFRIEGNWRHYLGVRLVLSGTDR
jgi:hypothetical protein